MTLTFNVPFRMAFGCGHLSVLFNRRFFMTAMPRSMNPHSLCSLELCRDVWDERIRSRIDAVTLLNDSV
jgi:hypothetical protein